MDERAGFENDSTTSTDEAPEYTPSGNVSGSRTKVKAKRNDDGHAAKRRCVSSACIACRRRKSKCDGNLPSCAACSSVYHTPCIYDPNSDHRRKGVYKKDIDNLRTRNTTLQTLIHAILNYDEDSAFELVRQIRLCDSLEDVADAIMNREQGISTPPVSAQREQPVVEDHTATDQFESELAGKMSELVLDGSVKFIGGTSNLLFLPPDLQLDEESSSRNDLVNTKQGSRFSVAQWTRVTDDEALVKHLMNMYFTWHYAYFTTLSKNLFYRDFRRGQPSAYCSSFLVNTMLALGCHFSSWPGAYEHPEDSATAGDHFFREAKRLLLEHDEHEKAKLCTVQALALMSVREAGCGREGKGWVYSGMSFRMAYDLGLNFGSTNLGSSKLMEEDIDARRITFWGCYLFDKCWSNYLGRQPQLSLADATVPKFEVYPAEEAAPWVPYTDNGIGRERPQPARTRAVALQISKLCEISNDLLAFFYHPMPTEKQPSRQAELSKLSDLHTRLEAWKKGLPAEMEPKDGQLPPVLLMHMFYQLLFIHLYRPFLKYTKSTSPLPQHVSPRRLCSQAAAAISKLLRIYKKSYGLRQICNIAVYIVHSACTIHLLNLPDRNARRDLIHGVRNLEEIGEGWLCARRTLRILDLSAVKWHIEIPNEVTAVFDRTRVKWGSWGTWDQVTSPSVSETSPMSATATMSVPVTHKKHDNLYTSSTTLPQQQPALSHSNCGTTYATMPTIQHPMAANIPPTRYPDQLKTLPFENYPPVSNQTSPPPSNMTHLHPSHSMAYTQPNGIYQTHQPQDIMTMNNQDISCNNSNSSNSPVAVSGTPPMPVFNGITDNLIEESQDWWMRDQSALALGLENWGEGWAGNQFMNLNIPAGSPSTPHVSRSVHQNQHHLSLHPDGRTTIVDMQPHVTGSETLGNLHNMPRDGMKHAYGYTNMPPPNYQ
ncbi:C6 transcription factor (NirA), putative [Talaromyces stipitatus ATCC 10500]|uniref:C6 transcription factor (NirA), putative n=1 Tax=Talaromyces stipitatus (strain ATCC 10500 / CBS 375.48 / QM 6759 / NRRL 1006) TaxID=441959 RepID=B8LXG7_TALSN|nr:C6 transcription factor (NirA), putative [Talaromyces stipitatus ATCC 10500]EED23248.1 C6 transcription factor (NirA), putative [Talaromyces stipitatus ATCC 10500]